MSPGGRNYLEIGKIEIALGERHSISALRNQKAKTTDQQPDEGSQLGKHHHSFPHIFCCSRIVLDFDLYGFLNQSLINISIILTINKKNDRPVFGNVKPPHPIAAAAAGGTV